MTDEKATLQAQAEVEELGPCKSKLTIEVPAETIKAEMDKSFRELANTVTTKGFRPGHAPRRLVERRFGEEVTEQVKQDLIDRSLQEVLEEKGLQTLGAAQVEKVEFDPEQALSFEATVLLRPSFEIKDYIGMELSQPSALVTDEELAAQLEQIRRTQAHLEPMAGGAAVEENHVLIADILLNVGEEEVWKLENAEVPVGERNWLLSLSEEINDKLIGLKVGQEAALTVNLKDDFPLEKYRGERGDLKVHLKEVKQVVVPELDEEFAKRLQFSSLNELKEKLKSDLAVQKQREVRALLESRLLAHLLEMVDFELPEEIVQAQAERMLNRHKLQLQKRGAAQEKIEEEAGKLAEASKERAAREFKTYFILEKIAEQEKIFATEAEVRAQVAAMAASYNTTVQRMRDILRKQGVLPELRVQIREAKTVQYLIEKAKIVQELEVPAQPALEKEASQEKPTETAENQKSEEK